MNSTGGGGGLLTGGLYLCLNLTALTPEILTTTLLYSTALNVRFDCIKKDLEGVEWGLGWEEEEEEEEGN
jgi:hypothetical protein